MAKRVQTVTYTCCAKGCGKSASAPIGSALALLQICEACQAKRFAAGKAAQEAARG